MEKCETERDIAYVAAGPLEDIMKQQPESIKETLENALDRSAKMKKALKGVRAAATTTTTALGNVASEIAGRRVLSLSEA